MGYPTWWNKTVTLYNRFEDADGVVKYRRTVLSGCFVKTASALIVSGDTGKEKPQTTIRIRNSRNYVSVAEWLTDENKRNNGFTIQNGDIIVMGNVPDDIDEYESGKRSDNLINKYKSVGCITVEAYSINDFGTLAHYKVVGV